MPADDVVVVDDDDDDDALLDTHGDADPTSQSLIETQELDPSRLKLLREKAALGSVTVTTATTSSKLKPKPKPKPKQAGKHPETKPKIRKANSSNKPKPKPKPKPKVKVKVSHAHKVIKSSNDEVAAAAAEAEGKENASAGVYNERSARAHAAAALLKNKPGSRRKQAGGVSLDSEDWLNFGRREDLLSLLIDHANQREEEEEEERPSVSNGFSFGVLWSGYAEVLAGSAKEISGYVVGVVAGDCLAFFRENGRKTSVSGRDSLEFRIPAKKIACVSVTTKDERQIAIHLLEDSLGCAPGCQDLVLNLKNTRSRSLCSTLTRIHSASKPANAPDLTILSHAIPSLLTMVQISPPASPFPVFNPDVHAAGTPSSPSELKKALEKLPKLDLDLTLGARSGGAAGDETPILACRKKKQQLRRRQQVGIESSSDAADRESSSDAADRIVVGPGDETPLLRAPQPQPQRNRTCMHGSSSTLRDEDETPVLDKSRFRAWAAAAAERPQQEAGDAMRMETVGGDNDNQNMKTNTGNNNNKLMVVDNATYTRRAAVKQIDDRSTRSSSGLMPQRSNTM